MPFQQGNILWKLRKSNGGHLGKKHTEAAKKKISIANKGRIRKPFSLEHKHKMALSKLGPKNPNWIGGLYKHRNIHKFDAKYRNWRTAVFKRDNYNCVFGGKLHGNKIEADHIIPWAEYQKGWYDINNGRTLCKDCHKKVTKAYFKAKKLLSNK